ncbi:MAG: hypothetical protein D6718_01895 [Acidobacteria bacterium]|nr:MAG: hypothetical protein D6718_01895 [Acidobacteriota bacterium]
MSGRIGKGARTREAGGPHVTYRAVRMPSGALLPIEARLGRRVLRTIPPDSEEGRRLLERGEVEILEQRRAPRTTKPPPGWLEEEEDL